VKNIKNILVSCVVIVFVISGCSQDNVKPLQEPIDSVNVDGGVNGVQTINNENSSGFNTNSKTLLSRLSAQLQVIYFYFDQYDIGDSRESTIKKNIDVLTREENVNTSIKLEGNCDEWGNDQYNYALGLKRAKAVKEFLLSEGISANKVSIVSYGESNGVCNEKTKSCWAKNRRVDFKVLP
jgi:peptidoglycan-associated lipoprotein